MLPENQFLSSAAKPAPSSETDGVDRRRYYDTETVTEKTFMTRFTLLRKVKDGKFPAPAFKKGRHCFYCKRKVNQWIKENPDFTQASIPKSSTSVTSNFSPAELKMIRNAATALGCSINFFISDAALWKARGVIKRLEYENN
jgi:predicted DNA-binding transcriptional regulator AlpA